MAAQQNLTVEKAEDIIRGFKTTPYGILGQQLTAKKKLIDVAPLPSSIKGLAFVDPAGMHHIKPPGGPKNAHGAAGAIYNAVGIHKDDHFPQAVIDGIHDTCDAVFHEYVKKTHNNPDSPVTTSLVIHCVGPDFRKLANEENEPEKNYQEAIRLLSTAYTNILSEFLKSGMPALRLLPVSGGIFSGEFGKLNLIPELTWKALVKALLNLSSVQIVALQSRDIEFCLFMEKELVDFCKVGFTFKSKEAVDFVKTIPLKPYGVLGQQFLNNEKEKDIIDVAAFPAAIPGLVFVDPAGLHHIKPPGGPKNAHGAAGAIYKSIGIVEDDRFPEDVINMIHTGGDAAYHKYINNQNDTTAEFLVIHAIGPDFRKPNAATNEKSTRSQAVEALGRAYGNILSEFVRSGQPALRLLPLSGGIHSGDFLPQIPTLTWEALQIGYWYLGCGEREAVCRRNIDLCIFAQNEFKSYEHVGFDPNAKNPTNLVYQGYAAKAEAATLLALGQRAGAPSVQFNDPSPRGAADSSSTVNPPKRPIFRRSISIDGEDYAEYYFGPISKHMSIFASNAVSTVSGVLGGLQRKQSSKQQQGVDPISIKDEEWDATDQEDNDADWTTAGPVTESMFTFGIRSAGSPRKATTPRRSNR